MKTPKFWYKDNSILKYILYPLTSLWLLASYLKKAYVKPKKFSVPIICVGNIIAGGSGKTPLTIQLAKLLPNPIGPISHKPNINGVIRH